VGVGGDFLVDFKSESKGGAAGFGGDTGWGACADGLEEIF